MNQAAARARDARSVKKIAGVSFEQVRTALGAALAEKFPPPEDDKCSVGPWVRDVFDDTVVYEQDGGLFRISYTFDGAKATLSGNPEAVMVSYVPVGSTPAPGAAPVAAQSGETESAKAARLAFAKAAKEAGDAISALAKRRTPTKGA